MAIKPILFNTEMVRAILEGRKSCTRRIVKDDVEAVLNSPYHKKYPEVEDKQLINKLCIPPYQPGDILYVRETWFYEHHMEDRTAGAPDLPSGRYSHRYIYRADDPIYPVNIGVGAYGWHPSIHMPKEAARIWLKVTDVRVERLQEIDEDGVWDEGFGFTPPCLTRVSADGHTCDLDGPCASRVKYCDMTMGELFGRELWNSTIKKSDLARYDWNVNPYVWVIEFERCEKPEGM